MFLKKLESEINNKSLGDKVKVLGFVGDQDLALLYRNALAFVFPSRSEVWPSGTGSDVLRLPGFVFRYSSIS